MLIAFINEESVYKHSLTNGRQFFRFHSYLKSTYYKINQNPKNVKLGTGCFLYSLETSVFITQYWYSRHYYIMNPHP